MTETEQASYNAESLLELNRTMFTRIYPAGDRVDSSNFRPDKCWLAGCQMVLLLVSPPIFISFSRFLIIDFLSPSLRPSLSPQYRWLWTCKLLMLRLSKTLRNLRIMEGLVIYWNLFTSASPLIQMKSSALLQSSCESRFVAFFFWNSCERAGK